MLEITEDAVKHLAEVGENMTTNDVIRIAVMGNGGTKSGLGLIIDQTMQTDIVSTHGEYTVAIDKNLMEYCKTITIDFTNGEPNRCDSLSKRGFLITAENPLNI